jgi:hypothetical protein
MAIILAQAVLHTTDGLPENYVTNTFHFSGPATVPVAEDLGAAIEDFYDGETGLGNSIGEYLSASIVRTTEVHEVRFYNVTSGVGGTPFHTHTFGIVESPLAVYRLPSEVAVCLSYEATPVAGGIQARRRGRVYIGPLCSDALDGGTSRPSSSLQTDLLAAAQRLHDAALLAEAPWVVYSRVDEEAVQIDRGWVDNACDTQRRRGLDATARLTSSF